MNNSEGGSCYVNLNLLSSQMFLFVLSVDVLSVVLIVNLVYGCDFCCLDHVMDCCVTINYSPFTKRRLETLFYILGKTKEEGFSLSTHECK